MKLIILLLQFERPVFRVHQVSAFQLACRRTKVFVALTTAVVEAKKGFEWRDEIARLAVGRFVAYKGAHEGDMSGGIGEPVGHKPSHFRDRAWLRQSKNQLVSMQNQSFHRRRNRRAKEANGQGGRGFPICFLPRCVTPNACMHACSCVVHDCNQW